MEPESFPSRDLKEIDWSSYVPPPTPTATPTTGRANHSIDRTNCDSHHGASERGPWSGERFHVSGPWSGERVKKVRFCEVEPKKVRFCNEFPAAALCSSVECSHVARGRCDYHNTVTDMFCDEHQQITIEANKKANRQTTSSSLQLMKIFGKAGIPDKPAPEEHADMLEETRRNIWAKRAIFNGKRAQEQSRTHFDPLEEVDDYVESGDEGIEDFGFGSESDEEATAVLPTRKMFDGSRGLREAPRSRLRFTNSAAVNGVSINSDVDNDTVQINAVAGAGTKWSSKASIRFNVADVQRPLASASKVVAKGNRIVLEEGGSFIQSVSTGEKIALRVERGVYVFDAKYEDGSTGTMALDSGAGVCVWPQDWKIDAPMEPKVPGLRMVAANGTEIANLGQKVIRFNAIQPFAGQR